MINTADAASEALRRAQQIAVREGSSGKIIVADQNWRILDEVLF